MATETITRLVDDLDGGTAERTVSFAWDGKSYEVDLSKKNIAAFERAIKPYLTAARTHRSTSGGGPRQGRRAASTRRTDLSVIRDWARANGYEVSDRGRIGAAIVEAYEAAR